VKTKTTWLFKYWVRDCTFYAERKYFSTKKQMLKFIKNLDWTTIDGHIIKKSKYMVVSKKLTYFYYDEFCVTTKGKIKCFWDMKSSEKELECSDIDSILKLRKIGFLS
jgi:hypothetical protein